MKIAIREHIVCMITRKLKKLRDNAYPVQKPVQQE